MGTPPPLFNNENHLHPDTWQGKLPGIVALFNLNPMESDMSKATDKTDTPDAIDMAVERFLALDSGDQGEFLAEVGGTFGEAIGPVPVERSIKRHKDDRHPLKVAWTFSFAGVTCADVVKLAVDSLVVKAQNSSRTAAKGKEASTDGTRAAVAPVDIRTYQERTWNVVDMLPKARKAKAPPTAEETMQGFAGLTSEQRKELFEQMQAMMESQEDDS